MAITNITDEWRDKCRRTRDEWRRMRDEWKRMRDECRWMKDEGMQTNERWLQTNEDEWRQMRDQCRRVKTNERQAQTNETQMRRLVHLQDDSRCLRAFTFLNMLTDLMFKTSILFPFFGYFGPYWKIRICKVNIRLIIYAPEKSSK